MGWSIGLDLGTSSLKAIVVDEYQAIRAEAHAPLSVQRPHDGWSEQDPMAWEAACDHVLGALAAAVDLAPVRAIGLSGQMHGATAIGADDRPLRASILWNDTRAAREAAELDADPDFRAISGNIVFAGFTAPKLVWMQRHEPDLFARMAKVLLPKDYLRLWLTGEHVSEMSDAAGTSWLDTGARAWSDLLLARTGLDRSHMPRLVEGDAPSGQLRAALAAKYGMGRDVIVAGGGGDNAAAAIGAGVVSDGQAFLSLGTSGVLFAASAGYRPAPQTAVHSFCHAVTDGWHQMGVILAAADALEWLSRLTGKSPKELSAAALARGPQPSPLLFLPYLGGERTPHNDARIRGQFLGLDHATDAAEAAFAVMQGVGFAFADCQMALAATGTHITEALALGGGAGSDLWLQILADIMGVSLARPSAGEFGAALGAARLGLIASGQGSATEIITQPPIARRFDPDPARHKQMVALHARYRAAYARLKDLQEEGISA